MTTESELESWREEKQSAWLYRVIAEVETGTSWQPLFARLGEEAERQALIWAEAAQKAGTPLPPFSPSTRARIVATGVRRLGARRMQSALAAMKIRGLSVFSGAVPSDGGHAVPTGASGTERRHGAMGKGGNLRAAVFGANDGLVSNTSLLLGVAGASADGHLILLSGVAGLLAGAFSMASGEYVSVRSQRELLEYQLGLERDELERYPEEEAAELALIYQARGLSEAEAKALANRIFSNPESALDTLAREELGLDPAELGSPLGAAVSSFLSFASGAVLPLLPFLVFDANKALPASIVVSSLALFGIGAALSLFTGRGALAGGLRMLGLGAAAGAATFSIGRLLGVSVQ